MSSWKRGFLEIMSEILESLMSSSLKKTHITFKCNLDSRAVTKYIKFMLEIGLIEKSKLDSSLYKITEKGITYRNKFNSFLNMMEEDIVEVSAHQADSKQLLENLKLKIRT